MKLWIAWKLERLALALAKCHQVRCDGPECPCFAERKE